MATYQNFCEIITKQLFDIIDENGSLLAWQKNWDSKGCARLPVGMSGMYHGFNLLSLFCAQHKEGFKSHRWLTFNQVRSQGACVKKGAKGRAVCFWKTLDKAQASDNTQDDDKKMAFVFKNYTVFNADQTTLDESVDAAPLFSSQAVDQLVEKLGVTISHFGGVAYYNPQDDLIILPEQKHFKSEANYYAVLLHEILHQSGSENRLARDCLKNYSKSEKDRAQEELIAEIGSVFLASHFGLQAELENHASYVQGWKQHLSEKEIMQSVSKATQAFEWILDQAGLSEIKEHSIH